MARYELNDIKAAAIGHWPAILNRVAGIDDDYLSIHHGPCPKCGGTDRWRCFRDYDETGGAVCNQCGKFADGIAVVQWMLGVSFPEALRLVGEFLGVQPAKPKPKPKGKPTDGASRDKPNGKKKPELLPDGPQTDQLIAMWCMKKRLSLDAVKRLQPQLARWRGQRVLAFPVIEDGETIGWSMYEIGGGKLPYWNPRTKEKTWLKVQTIKFK